MPRFPSHQSVAIAIAVLVVTALGACSGTGETREPGADRTRVTYRCSDRQIIRVLYDYTTPSAPVARVLVKGQTFEMRSVRSQPGSARYSTESGLRDGHDLQWWTRGNQATLSEMPLLLFCEQGFPFVGHVFGDTLLVAMTERLPAALRAYDLLVRQGGDEWIVVLPGLYGQAEAVTVARRLLEMIAQPVTVEGSEIQITASIGIALYPQDAQDADGLLRCADIAMYAAKSSGGNEVRLFESSMRERVSARVTMEGRLRRAIENGELLCIFSRSVISPTGGWSVPRRWVGSAFRKDRDRGSSRGILNQILTIQGDSSAGVSAPAVRRESGPIP